MCLRTREKDSNKPYKSSDKYRYKMVIVGKAIRSRYVQSFEWSLGRWERAEYRQPIPGVDRHSTSIDPKDIGFHVFVDKAPIRKDPISALGVFQVSRFIASGRFHDSKTETWKDARLVAYYENTSIHPEIYTLTDSIKGFKGKKKIRVK